VKQLAAKRNFVKKRCLENCLLVRKARLASNHDNVLVGVELISAAQCAIRQLYTHLKHFFEFIPPEIFLKFVVEFQGGRDNNTKQNIALHVVAQKNTPHSQKECTARHSPPHVTARGTALHVTNGGPTVTRCLL
jgi:hypothetical protein